MLISFEVKPLRRFHLLHENGNSSTFELAFVSSAPSYHSDLYEYTWQRQTHHPPIEHVVFSTSERGSDGSRSVLISIDSDREYSKGEGCAKILRAFSDRLTSVLPIPCSDRSPCSTESAYLGALFTVLIILAETTNDFINSVHQITASLVRSIHFDCMGVTKYWTALPRKKSPVGKQASLPLTPGR